MKIVIKKIIKKFGTISSDDYEKLRALKDFELEIVVENIDSFEGIEDVNKYFRFDDEEN